MDMSNITTCSPAVKPIVCLIRESSYQAVSLCHSLSVTHCQLLTVSHSLSVAHYQSLTVSNSLSVTHCQVTYCQSLNVSRSLSVTHCQSLTISHSLSSHLLSVTHCHPPTVSHSLSVTLRHFYPVAVKLCQLQSTSQLVAVSFPVHQLVNCCQSLCPSVS